MTGNNSKNNGNNQSSFSYDPVETKFSLFFNKNLIQIAVFITPFLISFFIWCSNINSEIAVIKAQNLKKEDLKEAVYNGMEPTKVKIENVEKRLDVLEKYIIREFNDLKK